MSYYRLLNLEKEPFSTSPDPEFLYLSKEHNAALYRIRISVELKRGLCLVMGDIGTGKTTLSRKLSQFLFEEKDHIVVVILNPAYDSELQFLIDLMAHFHIEPPPEEPWQPSVIHCMKLIEKFLFDKAVVENKTVVLLIDEAQKLNEPCLELLRSLLNYETNEFKILQLVLMGQMELVPKLNRMRNLLDRAAVKYIFNPFEESEVKAMIRYRLERAGYRSDHALFSRDAIRMITEFTQGYPRKITMMCHEALIQLAMRNKKTVDRSVIQDIILKETKIFHQFQVLKPTYESAAYA